MRLHTNGALHFSLLLFLNRLVLDSSFFRHPLLPCCCPQSFPMKGANNLNSTQWKNKNRSLKGLLFTCILNVMLLYKADSSNGILQEVNLHLHLNPCRWYNGNKNQQVLNLKCTKYYTSSEFLHHIGPLHLSIPPLTSFFPNYAPHSFRPPFLNLHYPPSPLHPLSLFHSEVSMRGKEVASVQSVPSAACPPSLHRQVLLQPVTSPGLQWSGQKCWGRWEMEARQQQQKGPV